VYFTCISRATKSIETGKEAQTNGPPLSLAPRVIYFALKSQTLRIISKKNRIPAGKRLGLET
jgi:hypothetical protein